MAKKTAPAGGNVFTKKIGPLPGWVWVGAGVGALILFSYSKKSSTTNTTAGNTNGDTAGALAAANYVSASKATAGATTTAAPDSLTTFLAGLAVGAQPASTTPGNTGVSVSTPGSTGNPAIQPVNSAAYAVQAATGTSWASLGSIVGANGLYQGLNVGGGAPVYANVGGTWQQNFNADNLPVGTQLATPTQFSSYINTGAGIVTEDL